MQKTEVQIILKDKYRDYISSLDILDIEDINTRREKLCLSFSKKCVKNATINFERNNKLHNMLTRNKEDFKISHCHTERLKKSAIPQMQRLLTNTSAINIT